MKRPNVLVLTADQLRFDAVGWVGNTEVLTPNLDRLAAKSTSFLHHFVQNPVCMPSRASFLSGQYPGTIGITHMGVPLPELLPLLPHYLAPYGYRTANIGKLHALPHANRDHRIPHPSYGFDHLEISDEPGPYEDAYRAWVRKKSPKSLDAISLGLPPTAAIWQQTMGPFDSIVHAEDRLPLRAVPFPAGDDLTHTAFVGEQTRAFIEQQGAQPWLCVAGFYSPHSPWVVPQRYLDLYDPATLTIPDMTLRSARDPRGRGGEAPSDDEVRSILHGYYAMISEVDAHIGQILDTLEAQGQADSTMIVFTSDHGEWLGRYGRYGKGYPADDAISRVPLLIRQPGQAAARVCDEIVEALDVLPTILDTCAIQVPPALQGTSLLPLMTGQASMRPGCAITEHTGWKTLRTRNHRYLVEADGSEHLYDLSSDPEGLVDIAATPEAATHLGVCRNLLLQRLIARERPLARTWTY